MQRVGPRERRHRQTDDPKWKKFFDDDQIAQMERQQLLEMSLADTGLSVRIVNNLENHGVFQVRQLAQQSRDDLLAMENFGEQNLGECRRVVDELGIAHPRWNRPGKIKRRKKRRQAEPSSAPQFSVQGTQTGRFASDRPSVSNTCKTRAPDAQPSSAPQPSPSKTKKKASPRKSPKGSSGTNIPQRSIADKDLEFYFGEATDGS